jgi:hypothetical protein
VLSDVGCVVEDWRRKLNNASPLFRSARDYAHRSMVRLKGVTCRRLRLGANEPSLEQRIVQVLIEILFCILYVPCEGDVQSRVDPVPNSSMLTPYPKPDSATQYPISRIQNANKYM